MIALPNKYKELVAKLKLHYAKYIARCAFEQIEDYVKWHLECTYTHFTRQVEGNTYPQGEEHDLKVKIINVELLVIVDTRYNETAVYEINDLNTVTLIWTTKSGGRALLVPLS